MLVVVCVGGAGCAVGAALMSTLARAQQPSPSPSRDGGTSADPPAPAPAAFRVVLVDSDPHSLRAAASSSSSSSCQAVAVTAGADSLAGSWARGYAGAGALLRRAVGAVRRELQRCPGPAPPDLLLVHGLGGGAGGGLAAALLEALRDSCGGLFVGVAALLPLPGASPLAPLGAVLNYQFLQEYADVVLLLQGGELLDALEKAAASSSSSSASSNNRGGSAVVSLAALNAALACQLAGALLPCGAAFGCGPVGRLVAAIAPSPRLKFPTVLQAPRAPTPPSSSLSPLSPAAVSAFEGEAEAWSGEAAAAAAAAGARADPATGRRHSVTAALALLRGAAPPAPPRPPAAGGRGRVAGASLPPPPPLQQQQPIGAPPPPTVSAACVAALAALTRSVGGGGALLPLAPGLEPTQSLAFASTPARLPGAHFGRCATLVANRSCAATRLASAARGAEGLLWSGAYLHVFAADGVEPAAVADAVAATRYVVAYYEDAHWPP